MGNGRHSGLPKGIRNTTHKVANSNLTITSRNASQFGINLVKHASTRHSTEERTLIAQRLDEALNTINKLGQLIGLRPDNLPVVDIHFGRHNSTSFGDAVIHTQDESKTAVINLYAESLLRKNFDTAAHEYVHALEAWFIKSNFSNIVDRRNAWKDSIYSEAICRNALVKIGKQSNSVTKLDKVAWKSAADTIKLHGSDNYASSQPCETVTRAVQVVLRQGKNAPAYAHAIVNELKAEVARNYKKLKK